jgi:hypothetical protein
MYEIVEARAAPDVPNAGMSKRSRPTVEAKARAAAADTHPGWPRPAKSLARTEDAPSRTVPGSRMRRGT